MTGELGRVSLSLAVASQ